MTFAFLARVPSYALTLWGWLLLIAFGLAVTGVYVALRGIPRRILAAFGVALVLAFVLFPPIVIDFCQYLCCDWYCWI